MKLSHNRKLKEYDKDEGIRFKLSALKRIPKRKRAIEIRDSIMTMQFDKFGGGPYYTYEDAGSTFSDNEKIRLAELFRETVHFSQKSHEASKSGFSEHLPLLKKWFGITPSHKDYCQLIKILIDEVNKMHAILSDSTRILRFVDQRNKNYVSFCVQYYHPLIGRSGRCGEKEVHGKYRISPPCEDNLAAVQTLCYFFPEERDVFHVGSGTRLYIGARMFLNTTSDFTKKCAFYHELSHLILGAVDLCLNSVQ